MIKIVDDDSEQRGEKRIFSVFFEKGVMEKFLLSSINSFLSEKIPLYLLRLEQSTR